MIRPAPDLCLAMLLAAWLPAVVVAQQQEGKQEQGEEQAQQEQTGQQTQQAQQPAAAQTPQPMPRATMDRLELDATAIIGNRELPKVLYIVPWKKSDLGDLTGRPTGSLLDEVLAPVDREVFRRQTAYYEALNSRTATSGTDSSTGKDNKGSER